MTGQRRQGFTLIELLVVIAIIAILAAILFPVFAQAKTAAKKARAIAQLKQVGTATQIYMSDYDDMTPPKVRWGSGPAAGGGDPFNSMLWDDFVQPYLKNWDLLMSSEDNFPKYTMPNGRQYRRSFAPAGNLLTGVQPPANAGWTGYAPLSGTGIPEPSASVMFVESRMPIYTGLTDPRNRDQWWWAPAAKSTRSMNLPSSDARAPFGQIDNKYNNTSVYVMSDSSARAIVVNGRSTNGTVHGTILPGYEEKAEWWVGSPDPFWDRGISCLDAPWNANDRPACRLPGQ